MRKIMFLLITTVLFCGWGVNASVASVTPLYETVTVDPMILFGVLRLPERMTARI